MEERRASRKEEDGQEEGGRGGQVSVWGRARLPKNTDEYRAGNGPDAERRKKKGEARRRRGWSDSSSELLVWENSAVMVMDVEVGGWGCGGCAPGGCAAVIVAPARR